MSAVPAARYLADFGAGASGKALQPGGAVQSKAENAAAKLEEAFARGVSQGRADATAEAEAKAQEQRAEFAEQLSAARQEWAESIGEELNRKLEAALAELENRIAETTARVLKPFLAEALHRQAVAELRANLDTLLAAGSAVAIAITGPADVLDALRPKFEDRAADVTFTADDSCDVRVVAGQTTLETQLGSWVKKLDEAVP